VVSFIGGRNRSTRRKPLTCRKSLTNFIPYYCIEHTTPWTGFELRTLMVKGTNCTGSCKQTIIRSRPRRHLTSFEPVYDYGINRCSFYTGWEELKNTKGVMRIHKLTNVSYIETLFKFLFIQDSGLFMSWFKQVPLCIRRFHWWRYGFKYW